MRRNPLKTIVVTSSRADWGYLSVPVGLMRSDNAFDLAVVATGQHLDTQSGETIAVVEKESGPVAARVAMTQSGDTALDITRAMSEGLTGFGEVFAALQPDIILLLGDRYEILAAACAGLMARIPMAHMAGGDVSEGAIDDAIRHAITKLAHLHFPTNTEAAERIVRMGEDPARIHCVGSTGLDLLLKVKIMERDAFFEAIGHAPQQRTLLVTMHPVT
ncbi:MAG: UDP-N-acetylglucosamine 2-epimerase, partial [Aestuariivirga sp.]